MASRCGDDVRFNPSRNEGRGTARFPGGGKDGRRAESYLRWLESRACSAGTVRTYGYHILVFLRFCRRRRCGFSQVRAGHIVDLLQTRRVGRDPPSARTLNAQLSALRGLFSYLSLMEPRTFKQNPVEAAAPLRAPRRSFRHRGMLGHLRSSRPCVLTLQLPCARRLPVTLPDEAIAALQGSLRTMRDRSMALLMFLAGLRSCEVLSLRLEDVDFRSGMVRVEGKASRERVVPVARDVLQTVERYVTTERPPTSCDRVFVVHKGKNRGKPLKPAGLRTVFRYHRKRAGVPAARPHRLRHTFASRMVEAGMRLEDLQAQLGHVSTDATMIYVHLAPGKVREAYLEALRHARKRKP